MIEDNGGILDLNNIIFFTRLVSPRNIYQQIFRQHWKGTFSKKTPNFQQPVFVVYTVIPTWYATLRLVFIGAFRQPFDIISNSAVILHRNINTAIT